MRKFFSRTGGILSTIALLGMGLAILVWAIVLQSIQQQQYAATQETVQQYSHAIQETVLTLRDELVGLAALYGSHPALAEAVFLEYTRRVVRAGPVAEMEIVWARQDRTAQSSTGIPGYIVRHSYRAQSRYPAGHNLAANDAFSRVIDQAKADQVEISFVDSLPLSQSEQPQKNLSLYIPVYFNTVSEASDISSHTPDGYVFALLSIEQLVTVAFKHVATPVDNRAIYLFDRGAGSKSYLYSDTPHEPNLLTAEAEYNELISNGATEHIFLIGGRELGLLLYSSSPDSSVYRQPEPWLALSIVLLLSMLLVVYLRSILMAGENVEKKVTERTVELFENQLRLQTMLDTVADGIIVIDSDGVIESFNSASEKLFGYQADEVTGLDVTMLMSDFDRQHHKEYINSYLETGLKKVIGVGREVNGRRKDGSFFPMELSVGEMEIKGKSHFIGVLRDISERMKFEQEIVSQTIELMGKEERIRTILNTVVDGVIVIDDRGLVQTFNPAAERIFGYTREEVTGQNVSMLMSSQDEKHHDAYLENYATTGSKKIIGTGREVIGRHRTGREIPLDLAVGEMEVGGQRMFTGVLRDISERKHIEQMKSEFISTVSHELRTPLTSIKGSLELIVGQLSEELGERAKNMLEIAMRNSQRLALLINDILDLEKITSNNMEFEMKPENIVTVLQQAIEDNLSYAQAFNVSLTLDTDIDLAVVEIDAGRILQVLTNLLSNAVKFSESGGEVIVRLKSSGDTYRVSVIDNGRGIPLEFQSRIFGRFAQADVSDSREKGGTGLGLSICKAIVEYHHGRIDFSSEPDKGTTFFFELTPYAGIGEYSQVG